MTADVVSPNRCGPPQPRTLRHSVENAPIGRLEYEYGFLIGEEDLMSPETGGLGIEWTAQFEQPVNPGTRT
jgi:hypothetical protein